MSLKRKYYSARNSPAKNEIDLSDFKEIFFSIWQDFSSRGFFQEHFGIDCTDGFFPGKMGSNIDGYVLRKMRKANLWPFFEKYREYSEEDLFDMIEFFYDHISAPLEEGGHYHDWNQCGWHYSSFDALKGQSEFANEVNQFLNDYGDGYELTNLGEILNLGPAQLRPIFEAPIPASGNEIQEKLTLAVNKFRKHGSTMDERTEAIRNLADCLEFLRPKVKEVLNHKDEQDLFEIANNFGIRHFNQLQKTNYDKAVWLSWMFYFYFSTILACLNLLNRKISEDRQRKNKD